MATPATKPTPVEALTVSIEGPAVRETYPFNEIAGMLAAFAKLLDNAIAAHAERRGLARIHAIATFPRKGSFVLDVQLAIATAALATVPLNLQDLIETIKGAWDLTKLLFASDEKPHASIQDASGNNVIVQTNNGVMLFNPIVVQTAGESQEELDQIVQRLQLGQVERFRVSSEGKSILLTPEDKKLSQTSAGQRRSELKQLRRPTASYIPELPPGPRSEVEEIALEVEGDIVSFSKETRTGQISVTVDNYLLKRGDYEFVVGPAEDTLPYITGMIERRVILKCRRERRIGKSGRLGKTIRLHAFGITTSRTFAATAE